VETPQPSGKTDVLSHAPTSLRDMALRGSQARHRILVGLRFAALFIAIFVVSHFIITRLGLVSFIFFLAITLIGFLYSYASWRSLMIPLFMAVLSVGGFRFLWSVRMPGLPDLFLDRAAMIWLVVVFTVKSVVERRILRPPFLLDTLILINAVFLLVYILAHDFTSFNIWTKSYLLPYLAYFMAKNIVTNQKSMRSFLIMLAVLNVYYSITSIAEKFEIDQLVWPKSILYTQTPWWNRSNGPFNHAPLFGTVMGMILPIYLYLITTARNRLVQVASIAALVLGLAGLYFSYTRGSWLAGIAALSVAVLMNRRHYVKISAPALVLIPLVAFMLLGVGSDPVMKDRIETGSTMSARVGVAVTALRMWRDNPLIGVGFFKYRYERENYLDPVDVPIFGTVRSIYFMHNTIHDIYLGPLSETGLVGTFLQFLIYLVIFKSIRSHYRNRNGPPHFRYYILPVFVGMFVGYLIGGISIDYRYFSMVGVMFYSAAGIIYGYDCRQAVQPVSGVESDGRMLDEEA